MISRLRRMNRASLEAVALFATAFVVRVAYPDASFFGPDQVGVLLEGRGVLQGHLFPPGPGIGWTPFKLGPLFEWVTALGLLPRDRFADVLVLVSTIHAAAVVGWRRLFATIGGAARVREVRLVGWALALHPLSIGSGSAPISTSIVLPTMLVFVWGIVRWVQTRDARGFVVACVGAALVVQTHITTTFVLPMMLVGLAWRAPIGRRGILGLLLGALIAAPMVIPNLQVLRFDVFRHAGSAGAPFVTALFRALFLEGRVFGTAGAIVPGIGGLGYVACLLWSAFIVVGAVTVARRRDDALGKALVVFGFVVPTLCITLLPRGAFFYYFDSTVPFRAWLFANGVCALALRSGTAWLGVGTATVARVAAVLALVVPAGFAVAQRRAVTELGYVPVSMSRVDLREPLGRPFEVVGILTLGSVQALGRALDELDADPESIRNSLRGPWRWAAADSVGVWVAESRATRVVGAPSVALRVDGAVGDAPADGTARATFLVLHEDDGGVVPASAPVPVGRFRVYRFDDRLRVAAAEGNRIEGTIAAADGERVVLQVATDSTHPVRQAITQNGPLDGTSTVSRSGFHVWSSEIAATEVTVEIAPGELYVEQVRAAADAYAFVAANPEHP